jgi:putative tricarboxylic transport membrane protein
MLEFLLDGFVTILEPQNLMFLIMGVGVGIILGAIPGLTATMAIALVIPMTYYMNPVQAFTMIMGAYNGGTFGGSISAVLIGTPGTPAAAATVADGFKLGLAGKGGKAIKMALYASVSGCLFSCFVLILVAAPLARYALEFGPAEYAVLVLFSLTLIGTASGESISKGMIGGIMGLLFGTVGLDIFMSVPRFNFGINYLSSGIDLVVMLIGCLAFSEILVQVGHIARGKVTGHLPPPAQKSDSRLSFREYLGCFKTIFRSSCLGCGIGILPGLGSTLAAYVGYDMAKRNSKHPEKFGTGTLEGVAAAEAANNATCGADLIPVLSLGIPGDAVTALLMSAFLIQGLTPGPLIFREAPDVVAGLYAGLICSNLLMVLLISISLRGFTRLAQLSTTVIFPVVIGFCFIGVYAMGQNSVNVWIMIFFAVIGYLMVKFGYYPATLIIGFILSPLLEENFRQALIISKGSYGIFFNSYICIFFWLLTVYAVFSILYGRARKKRAAEALKN